MLARHTPTRMKGSSVFHGLKSWVSKLHPPLPLSSKESQRLLTALTTSFRQQLDQSHPQPSRGEAAKPGTGKPASTKAVMKELHTSSVLSADHHLASVLTNPLLATTVGIQSPQLDYVSAHKSLLQEPFQDTVSLLENYYQARAATVDIAALCLERFNWQLNQLQRDERRQLIDRRQAGKRTLTWLIESGSHDTAQFVDDFRLQRVLIGMLLEEGHEEIIWKWLETYPHLGPQEPTREKLNHWIRKDTVESKKLMYKSRWRRYVGGRIVQTLLRTSLDGSANAAISALLRARDLGIPLETLTPFVLSAWNRDPRSWQNTDLDKYHAFANLVASHRKTGPHDFSRVRIATFHPVKPSGLPVLRFLREVLGPELGVRPEWKGIRTRITNPAQIMDRNAYLRAIVHAAALLHRDGYIKDAQWLCSLVLQIWPGAYDRILEENVLTALRMLDEWSGQPSQNTFKLEDETISKPEYAPIASPSFT